MAIPLLAPTCLPRAPLTSGTHQGQKAAAHSCGRATEGIHTAPRNQPAAAMGAKDTTSKMFVVCGRDADLLYEAELNPSFDAESPTAHLSHFVLHAALDNVDHLIATTPDVYLRVVDNFNEKRVYAFCTLSLIHI